MQPPQHLLLTLLDGLVPLHIAVLDADHFLLREARRNAGDLADAVTACGDRLLRGNWALTNKGKVRRLGTREHAERRQALNAMARALAVRALTADGGIDFAGRYWCIAPGCRASSCWEHAAGDERKRPEPSAEPARRPANATASRTPLHPTAPPT